VRLIVRKIVQLILVLLVVSLSSYVLLSALPGDPAITILGPSATDASVKKLHHQLGLDKPLLVQYGHYIEHALTGNFGKSYETTQPVFEAIRQRLPVTLELLILSQLVAFAIAIPAGILAARRPDGIFDVVSSGAAFGFLALPSYVLAVFLVYFFAVKSHIFPATGYTRLTEDPIANLKSMVLPVTVLALPELAAYLRLLRTDMLATLQEDYITLAKSKGMSERFILLRHALRPSMFSVVTVAGLNFGRLLSGTLIVEVVFALPGISALTVRSVFAKDYITVQGTVLLITFGYVFFNFLVDLIYPVLDPRTRYAASV
jgi:peptide/nickel transport system permease protein